MLHYLGRFFGLPAVGSVHAANVDQLLMLLHLLMLLLFVGWAGYFVYVLWRFRQSRQPRADYAGVKSHASTYIEVSVVLAEMVLLFALAVPFWARAVDKFPDEKDATLVRVIARQFNWTARYPGPDGVFGASRLELVSQDNPLGLDKNDPAAKDDILTGTDEMAVPVGKPVIAYISSMDVIHSFKVTPLRITQDAIPGLVVPIHFTPTVTGTYQIQCSQLCGNGHYGMRGVFKVLSAQDYQQWLQARSGAHSAPVSYE